MKLLLDACVWGGAKSYLKTKGHDVLWAGDWSEDPGDREILEKAHKEGRVLVTLDKDFGELAILQGIPHSGILRLVDIAASSQGAVCEKVISTYISELVPDSIITVEPGRIRIRPPDDKLS